MAGVTVQAFSTSVNCNGKQVSVTLSATGKDANNQATTIQSFTVGNSTKGGSFSNQNPILKLLRNTGLIAFDVIPGVKPLVANYAMGLKA